MKSDSIKSDPADHLVALARAQGVACSTVKDGHVIVFTRKILESLIQKVDESGKDTCLVFIKRPDFSN